MATTQIRPRRALDYREPVAPATWWRRATIGAAVAAASLTGLGVSTADAAEPTRDTSKNHREDRDCRPKRSAGKATKSSYSKARRAKAYSSDDRRTGSERRTRSADDGERRQRRSSGHTVRYDYSGNRSSSSGSTSSGWKRSTGWKHSKYSKYSKYRYKYKKSYYRSASRYSNDDYNNGARRAAKYSRYSSYDSSRSSAQPRRSLASRGLGSTHQVVSAPTSAVNTTVSGKSLPMAKGTYRVGARFGATGLWARYHTGQDFSAPSGANVYSVVSGTVVSSRAGSWAGTHVVVKAADGSHTLYAHLSSKRVSVGQKVKAGQHIGDVGQTGRAFGNHLHFEYYKPGARPGDVYSASNPVSYLRALGLSL